MNIAECFYDINTNIRISIIYILQNQTNIDENGSTFTYCVSYENLNRLITTNCNTVSSIRNIIKTDKRLSVYLNTIEFSISVFNNKFSKYIDVDDDDKIENDAQISIIKVRCTPFMVL